MGSNIFIHMGTWDLHLPTPLCSRHMESRSRILTAENGPDERLTGVGVQTLQTGDERRQICFNCELCEMETDDSEHLPEAVTKQLY